MLDASRLHWAETTDAADGQSQAHAGAGSTFDIAVCIAIVAFTAALAGTALRMAPERFSWVFSEAGPFEQMSIVLWAAASIAVICKIRPFGARGLAFALLFAFCAAREASWHKAFTADSVLKISYYLKTPAPLAEKIAAGIVAAAFIGLLLYAAYIAATFLIAKRGLYSRSGLWLVLAGLFFVVTKIADRLPSIFSHSTFGALDPEMLRLLKAFEEGFEMLVPALFMLSVWISQSDRRYLS